MFDLGFLKDQFRIDFENLMQKFRFFDAKKVIE